MIRVVLAALLALALFGASLPAVESAARSAAADAGERATDDLKYSLRALTDSDPSAHGVPGARATVELDLPERAVTNAGLDYIAVGGHPDRTLERDTGERDVLVYRVTGGRTYVRTLDEDLETGDTDADPLVVRGDARLRLRYVRTDDGPTVALARPGV